MAKKSFILSVLVLPLMAACEDPPPHWSAEVEHCAVIAGRATEDLNAITIVKVKVQDVGDVRTVQLRFAYPEEGAPQGNITCGYAFDAKVRTDVPKRVVKAHSVHFKGRYLSENELNFVNTSPFRAVPEFKVTP